MIDNITLLSVIINLADRYNNGIFVIARIMGGRFYAVINIVSRCLRTLDKGGRGNRKSMSAPDLIERKSETKP